MNSKIIILSFMMALSTFSQAATKNLCDDLKDSGSSYEQIKKCQDKFGISDYAKQIEQTKKSEAEKKISNAAEAEKKQGNIETKKFTPDELSEAGFGKPFFALTDDYRNGKYKQERVTEGNALCTYLGYEKAVQSVVSSEMNQEDSNRKGLIIDTGLLGGVKSPELYKQDDPKVGVRRYVEITCVRRKDKTSDSLKSIAEDVVVLPEVINRPPVDSRATRIYDDKRGGKRVTTPHGYQAPDWMKNDSSSAKGQ